MGGGRSGTQRTGPRITVETAIRRDHAEAFYQLYLDAFEILRTKAVARQVLHREEFFEEMTDPRVWKYVAWGPDGRPIGLATLTNDLSTIPWISPDYFQHRYPDHAVRKAIYYLGFALIHPQQRSQRALLSLFSALVDRLIADDAVCAYDVCAYNNETMRFGDNIMRVIQRLAVAGDAAVGFAEIDSQTYYAASFTR